MDTTSTLEDALGPAVQRYLGSWAELGRRLDVSRQAVDHWKKSGTVPATKVDAVCTLLHLDDEARAELRRRAGFVNVEAA